MIGVFAAPDVFLFYVFFEVMLVPMYFLIGSYGGARRQYAAVKFFLYSLVGGLFMLAAVIGLWVLGGAARSTGTSCPRRNISTSAERWLFLGFFIAFAIKAPFFPFHTWLPDAGGAAPAGAAALLVGVLDKVGTFGILRYCLPLFPNASQVLRAARPDPGAGRHHLRRAARGRPERPEAPGVLHVDRALRLHRHRHLRLHHPGRDRRGAVHVQPRPGHRPAVPGGRHAGGPARLARWSPTSAAPARRCRSWPGCFFFAGLASLALPGTAPFVSEFLVLIGTFTVNKTVAVIATAGIILAAAYVLWMVQRTTQGTPNPANSPRSGRCARTSRCARPWWSAPLIALLLFFGFYPKPVLDVINPAVAATLHDIDKTDPTPGAQERQVSAGQ